MLQFSRTPLNLLWITAPRVVEKIHVHYLWDGHVRRTTIKPRALWKTP